MPDTATPDQPTLDDGEIQDINRGDATIDTAAGFSGLPEAAAVVESAVPAVTSAMEPNSRELAGDVPAMWVAAIRLAGRIYATEFVPREMRGKPATVLACILYGDELGIGPMQALQGVQIIEGRPGASPELMRALVNRAGHTIKVVEKSNSKVTLYGKRRDNDSESTVTFSIEDAVTAGLCTIKDGKPYARSSQGKPLSWEKYPRAMLMARATSELCRDIFSDVTAGLSYTPEEAATIEGGTWTPEQVDTDTGEIQREAFHEAP